MTSSKWFEVRFETPELCQKVELREHELPAEVTLREPVDVQRLCVLHVARGAFDGEVLVRLGSEPVLTLPADRSTQSSHLDLHLQNHCGEVLLSVEAREPGERSRRTELMEIVVPLRAPRELELLYSRILEDLQEVHLALVSDVLGKTRRVIRGSSVATFEPQEELRSLESSFHDLQSSLRRIGDNPSMELQSERRLTRWRPGDPLDAGAFLELARDPTTQWEGRRLRTPGRARQRRQHLSADLPEHRHLRAGLATLARRADQLERVCLKSAGLLRRKARDWNVGAAKGNSIFQRRDLPRAELLEEMAREGRRLGDRSRGLVQRYGFLRRAGKPSTKLGATPLFLGQRGYRDAFRVLRRLARAPMAQVDTGTMQIQLRSLDVLFEYWVFFKVLQALTELYGPADSERGWQLEGSVVFMELSPGLGFQWSLADGTALRLVYEPAFPPPWHPMESSLRGWRAGLVGAPLRPDVLLLCDRPGAPPRGLALDAKNTARFDRRRLFEVSDYRTLVHDPETGQQPIRQLWLVHRDTGARSLCSMPGYLQGSLSPPAEASILGAICLAPHRERSLRVVVERFLGAAMGGSDRVAAIDDEEEGEG